VKRTWCGVAQERGTFANLREYDNKQKVYSLTEITPQQGKVGDRGGCNDPKPTQMVGSGGCKNIKLE